MDNVDKFLYIKRTLFAPTLLAVVLLNTGCHQNAVDQKNTVNPSVPTLGKSSSGLSSSAQTLSVPTESEGIVMTCQRELVALSKINQQLYMQKKSVFDELLASASAYASVRGEISVQTKDTLDALYKYKTQKICNDIEQSIRQALISRGENFK